MKKLLLVSVMSVFMISMIIGFTACGGSSSNRLIRENIEGVWYIQGTMYEVTFGEPTVYEFMGVTMYNGDVDGAIFGTWSLAQNVLAVNLGQGALNGRLSNNGSILTLTPESTGEVIILSRNIGVPIRVRDLHGIWFHSNGTERWTFLEGDRSFIVQERDAQTEIYRGTFSLIENRTVIYAMDMEMNVMSFTNQELVLNIPGQGFVTFTRS